MQLLPRPWEAGALAILLAILLAQLVVPPIVGMADNGDFPRIMGRFSIGYAPGRPHQNYFTYSTVKFVVDPANHWAGGFLSSELLLTLLAFMASRAAGERGVFDIRFVGVTHALLLVAGVWLMLLWARRFPLVSRAVLAGMLVLVFSDVSYVAYFNSFYSEPASVLFLLLIPPLAGFLLDALKTRTGQSERSEESGGERVPVHRPRLDCSPPSGPAPSLGMTARSSPAVSTAGMTGRQVRTGEEPGPRGPLFLLIAFVAAALLFIAAKPQNALAGLFLAGYTLRVLPLREGRVWRNLTLCCAALLLVCAVVTYLATSRIVRVSMMHTAVFYELLAHSPTPERDLDELRLPQSLMKYRGTHPWQWRPPSFDDPQFVRTFLDRIGMGRVGLFYLHHPGRLISLFDRSSADALATPPRLGNFEASTGAAPYARSERFDLWTEIKTTLAPKTLGGMSILLGFFAIAAFAAGQTVAREDHLLVDLALVLIAIAATQFATVAILSGTIDTAKHMFLFRAIVDLLVVACAGAAVGAVASWTRRRVAGIGSAAGW